MNLATAATGLLGSHIVEKLVEEGRPVRVLIRETSDACFLQTLHVERFIGDLTDPKNLQKACQGVHAIYHAASSSAGVWPNMLWN